MKLIKSAFQFIIKSFFTIYFAIVGKPKVNNSMKRTIALYKSGDFSETFQQIRTWDAPYEEIDKLIPTKGIIVDLGCGDGLLANYIAISRPKTKVFGIDVNKDRIKDAKKSVKNASFVLGNVLKKGIPQADVILIIHVLHHLESKNAQEKLLASCKLKLKKNGKLIIAEVSEKPTLKYIFSWLTDHITVPILFEGKIYNPDVFFRSDKEWKILFKRLGFKTQQTLAHAGKPFSHVIFECKKI